MRILREPLYREGSTSQTICKLRGGWLVKRRSSPCYHLLVRPRLSYLFPYIPLSQMAVNVLDLPAGTPPSFFTPGSLHFPSRLYIMEPTIGRERQDTLHKFTCISRALFFFLSCNFILVSGFGSIFEDYGDVFKLFFRRNCVPLTLEVETLFLFPCFLHSELIQDVFFWSARFFFYFFSIVFELL